MVHGGGHAGHYGHYGGSGGYSGFRPIFPLLFYPMMGYWLYRQYYTPQQAVATEDPFVDFTAKLYFNLERSYTGFVTEQSMIQEEISTTDFAAKLESFLLGSGFERVIAIAVDGTEIYRRDLDSKEQTPGPKDNLEESFGMLPKTSLTQSILVKAYSTAGNFRSTLIINFASQHYASLYSVECILNSVPQIYFRKKTESEQESAARISRFGAVMLNSPDRSSFVIQERDFLVPILQNLATLFASTFRVKNGRIQLSVGRARAQIWRSVITPSK
jgi:hypothetical protein